MFAGVDEAGRGALAGPVVIALCILKPHFFHELIIDSKKLTSKKRKIAEVIIKKNCIYYDTCEISNQEIDELNIKNATKKGMKILINRISAHVDYIFIDWEKITHPTYSIMSFPKGEEKSINIAAASILAKEKRDRIMIKMDEQFPEYDFKNNKGYGTKDHYDKILIKKGTYIHRKSFRPLKDLNRSKSQ